MIYDEYDNDFEKAEMPTFEIIKPGNYCAYVDRAEFNQPDWSDYPRLQLTCKIIGGPYDGKVLFASADCNPKYIQYLKAMLVKLGFDPPPPPSKILDYLKEMLDRVLELKVVENKNRPEYPKVYVTRFIRHLNDPVLDGDDEDIPF